MKLPEQHTEVSELSLYFRGQKSDSFLHERSCTSAMHSRKIDSCPPLQISIIFLICLLICPVTVEDTVYGNTWHMYVRATPSILSEKVSEKTVPVIMASGAGDHFASKFDLILYETDSNYQKCETPGEPVTVFCCFWLPDTHLVTVHNFVCQKQ
jgi:hypothetical protein